MDSESLQEERFAWGRREDALVLHATGFRHPALFREAFVAYRDVLHLWLGVRSLRIATRRGTVLLSRAAFRDPEGAGRLYAALRGRIDQLPDGEARLEANDRLDARLTAPGGSLATRTLTLACVGLFFAQGMLPALEPEGIYHTELVRQGEWWRLVTANFLHDGLAHLVMNAIGLVVLGTLLERALGSTRTGLVIAAAGLGAMGGGALAGYEWALGASGLVAGIVGALVVLEFWRPEQMPAPWRLPRLVLIGAIVAEALVLLPMPRIGHAAHLGGFLLGAAMAMAVTRQLGLQPPAWARGAARLAAGGLLASLAVLFIGAADPSAATLRRAGRLLESDSPSTGLLNNEAWQIAVSEAPSGELLEAAQSMADRAVTASGGLDPNVIDTLAEVYFVMGRSQEAIHTIERAIALAPFERYFQEQRRRFRGERSADDRPAPPGAQAPNPQPWPEFPDRGEFPDNEEPGLRI